MVRVGEVKTILFGQIHFSWDVILMLSKYKQLENSIRNAGFFLTSPEDMGGWERIVVANKRTKKGLSGNSFWIANVGASWYVGTWGGRYYSFPSYELLRDFSIEVLSKKTGGTPTKFEDDILGRFRGCEVDLAVFDAALQRICNGAKRERDLARAKETFKLGDKTFQKEEWYEGELVWVRGGLSDRHELYFVFANERISIDFFDRVTVTPQRLKELLVVT